MQTKKTMTVVFSILLFLISSTALSSFAMANNASGPAPRFESRMVYDKQNNQTILFGGGNFDSSPIELETTWLFSSQSQSWIGLNNITSPGARWSHSMVYNSLTGKVLLFGGYSTVHSTRVNDMWEFDPSTNVWTELHPVASPSSRSHHAMYFDPIFNEIILFGGYLNGDTLSDETWIYNCTANNWNQIDPAIHPSERYGHTFAYDESLQTGVFFGGKEHGNLKSETWLFNRTSSTWSVRYVSAPQARYGTSIVYNPIDANFILFGGDNGYSPIGAIDDTWVLNATSYVWTRITTTTNPPPRTAHAIVFDRYLGRVLLFGGYGEDYTRIFGDFWNFDPVTEIWSQDFNSASEESSISIWILLLGFFSIASITRLSKFPLLRQKLRKTN